MGIGAIFLGSIMSNVEQAKYVVIKSVGNLEIRDYEPQIVAEVQINGEREEAINQGFNLLAGYIFGDNKANKKVQMTAPVTQQQSEKIAMTAPVTQQRGDSGIWTVCFVMPRGYSMETLPVPKNDMVKLKEASTKRFAVIRFSGTANQKLLAQQLNKLELFVMQHDLKPIANPTYAFFNPPWTLPFLRRNEVMIEIRNPG